MINPRVPRDRGEVLGGRGLEGGGGVAMVGSVGVNCGGWWRERKFKGKAWGLKRSMLFGVLILDDILAQEEN